LLRKLVMILGAVDAHPRGVAQVILEISFAEPGVTFKHYVVLVNDLGFSGEVHWVSFLVSYRLQGGSDIFAAVEAKSSGCQVLASACRLERSLVAVQPS